MLKIHLKKHYSATLYCWDNSVETDWRGECIEIVMQQNFAILSLLISSSPKIWQVIITWCCLYIIPYQLVRSIWILVMLQPVANYFVGCILKWNIFLASGRCRQSSQGSHGSFKTWQSLEDYGCFSARKIAVQGCWSYRERSGLSSCEWNHALL